MGLTDQILAILKNLVENRFNGNYSAASKYLGLDPRSGILQKWIQKTRSPTISSLEPIFERLGITLGTPDLNAAEYEYIPKVEAKAGAGASLDVSAETVGFYAFRSTFFAERHISAAKSVLMDVVGDSMIPLLQSGDTILVDQNDTAISDSKIYVVTLGEELRVKRLFKSINGYILRSENPVYPDIEVKDIDLDSFHVHGRVKWFGRIL